MDSGDMPKVADHAVGLPQRQPITGRPAGGASLDHLVGAREQGRRKIDRQRLCGIKIRTYLKIARGKRAVRSRGSSGRSIPNGRGCGAAIESKQRSAPRASVAYLAVAEIEGAIDVFPVGLNGGGLIVLPDPVTVTHRKLIIAQAAKRRMPAVYAYRFYVTSGGLASRILKGEKPGKLPVQYADKFELVIMSF